MKDLRDGKKFELRYHHDMPGWCKIPNFPVREIPLCEGGGYMFPETIAHIIVQGVNRAFTQEEVTQLISGKQ